MPRKKITLADGRTATINFDGEPKEADLAHVAEHIAQTQPLPTPQASTTRTWKGEILPVGGAVLGGTLGALSPVPGGAIGGTALGGAAGEAAQQGIERLTGQREAMAPMDIAKQGLEQGAMEAVGGPLLRAGGRLLKTGATKLVEAVLPRSAYEARLVRAYRAAEPFWQRTLAAVGGAPTREPRTVAATIVGQGLGGGEAQLGVQATRAAKSLWRDMIQPALRGHTAKVPMRDFFDELRQRIVHENKELNRQAELLKALDALKKPYERMTGASLEYLQQLKRGWAKYVPEKAYRGEPIRGAFQDVQDMAADLARETIHNTLGPEVRQAYLDYGNLTQVMEHGERAMTGGARRGGFGGFWSSVKDTAVTPVATIGAQVLYRTGQGMKLVGAPGARVVRDIVPALPEIGKDVENRVAIPQRHPAPAPSPTPTPQQVSALKPTPDMANSQ